MFNLNFWRKFSALTLILCLAFCSQLMARAGGGGGNVGGGGFGGSIGGAEFSIIAFILFAIIAIIVVVIVGAEYVLQSVLNTLKRIYNVFAKISGLKPMHLNRSSFEQILSHNISTFNNSANIPIANQVLVEGLDKDKVQTAFIAIQKAWQQKDLKDVRKWISDGVYQRFNVQFKMMDRLLQVNELSNISLQSITLVKTGPDGTFETAEVAIKFTMDDEFFSDKYPQLDERFFGDSGTEYWTFIKKLNNPVSKNLYDNNSCPNCGAPFVTHVGEISRCSQCGTLTNNATYDWVLSEITQEKFHKEVDGIRADTDIYEVTKTDGLFSVQRVEDVAANVFMQIMNVLAGEGNKKLSRFADPGIIDYILQLKKALKEALFNRLYLEDATLDRFDLTNEVINLHFTLIASYQRVQEGETIKVLSPALETYTFSMVLSKNLRGLNHQPKETVYSYECSNCAAPFEDTTDDVCTHCGAPVLNFDRNWVLTDFRKNIRPFNW